MTGATFTMIEATIVLTGATFKMTGATIVLIGATFTMIGATNQSSPNYSSIPQ